jgi:uncharacterized protein (TIGR02996 family)
MTQEAAFLAAIRDAPADTATRLVYADWLDERNEPRGELIRIEEERRQLPVFADRYWQLKPRRNELRSSAAPDWLEAMRYGTDVQPLFRHGVPDGWKERWRLIREFVERWNKRPVPDVGGHRKEVRAVEARLGRTLPPSVREWVAFARDVWQHENDTTVFRDVYQMKELDGHSAVSLLLQGEGDYHWAVRHADLTIADPSVYGFHLDYDNDENTFVPAQDNPLTATLTEFVWEYTRGYTYGKGGGFGTDVAKPAPLLRSLKAAFPVHCRFGPVEFFEADNILVSVGPSIWGPGKRIHVEVAKPLPREAIPEVLWKYTRNGGSFHGMFVPDDKRRKGRPPSG